MTITLTPYLITTPMTGKVVNGKNIALTVEGDEACILCPDFVYMHPDGGLRLVAPTHGAATESVHRTRTEWMEAFYWPVESAAHHWLRQTMTVERVNQAGRIVIGQMHVKNSNNPFIKIFWDKGAIKIGYREKETMSPVTTTICRGVELGQRVSLSLHVTKVGSVSLTVKAGGVSYNFSRKMDPSWFGFMFNFHGGLYNQLDYSDLIPLEDGSEATIHSLIVSHDLE